LRHFALLAILALSICLSVGAHAQETIKPGDSVSITVLGEPDLSKKFTVDQDGNINMPLVHQVHVAGFTSAQATVEIATQLKKLIKNPQVSIDQIESGKIQVTVAGEVKNPGILMLTAGSKLIDAITAAGGYTPNADLSKVSVSESASGANARTIDLSKFLLGGDVSVNVPISSGDTVHIPTKATNILGTVTVLGAVRQSGSQSITQGMTVREAIMLAGGPTEFADTSSVTIRHEGSTENAAIDYEKASAGDPAANVPVRPGDTIYIASRQLMGYYTIQGGIASPGRYDLKSPTSITEAIAIAGGIRGKVNLNEVSVLHGTSNMTKEMKMKIKVGDIMAGKTQNVLVQNGDSIIVPTVAEKQDLLKYATVAISLAWLFLRR
jgi:polysaccharide biosynthesis/export protein